MLCLSMVKNEKSWCYNLSRWMDNRLLHEVKVSGFAMKLREAVKKNQAENGLQSRSSENGKTAVWHYGLKLLRYLAGDRD